MFCFFWELMIWEREKAQEEKLPSPKRAMTWETLRLQIASFSLPCMPTHGAAAFGHQLHHHFPFLQLCVIHHALNWIELMCQRRRKEVQRPTEVQNRSWVFFARDHCRDVSFTCAEHISFGQALDYVHKTHDQQFSTLFLSQHVCCVRRVGRLVKTWIGRIGSPMVACYLRVQQGWSCMQQWLKTQLTPGPTHLKLIVALWKKPLRL